MDEFTPSVQVLLTKALLEMRIWIRDPENGISNVGSKVRLAVWDTFQQHGIEIPFPQRDIHIMTQASTAPTT